MSTESQLREKFAEDRGFVRWGRDGPANGSLAEAALERVRARLGELSRQDPSIEMQFSMPDQWSRHLFSCVVPTLWLEALPLLSAAAQTRS